jgi:hypothetical protein
LTDRDDPMILKIVGNKGVLGAVGPVVAAVNAKVIK